MKLTIVSQFYNLNSANPNFKNKIDDYLHKSKYLFNIQTSKIIFVDDEIFKILENRRNSEKSLIISDIENAFYIDDLTLIIKISFKDTKYGKYLNEVKHQIYSINDKKNSIEYGLLSNNKFFFLEKSIELNPFNSEYFMWMDFGITYVSFVSEELKIKLPQKGKIKISCIKLPKKNELDNQLHSFFHSILCSGIMISDSSTWKEYFPLHFEEFSELLKLGKTCLEQTLIEKIAFLRRRDLFEFYYADYPYLIMNLNGEIADILLCRISLPIGREMQKWDENILRCESIMQSYEKSILFYSKCDILYVLNELYISYYYSANFENAKRIAEYVKNNALVNYVINKDFYKNNFLFSGIDITPEKRKWKTRFVTYIQKIEDFESSKFMKIIKDEDIKLTIFIEEKDKNTLIENYDLLQNSKNIDIYSISEKDFKTSEYFKFELILKIIDSIEEEKITWIDFKENFDLCDLYNIDGYGSYKFRCCLIHFKNFDFMKNENMGMGLMNANKYYWKKIANLIIERNKSSDKKILMKIYQDYPHFFDLYYGDYQFLTKNYCDPINKVDQIIRLYLNEAIENEDYLQAWKCCRSILFAVFKGHFNPYFYKEILPQIYKVGKFLYEGDLLSKEDFWIFYSSYFMFSKESYKELDKIKINIILI